MSDIDKIKTTKEEPAKEISIHDTQHPEYSEYYIFRGFEGAYIDMCCRVCDMKYALKQDGFLKYEYKIIENYKNLFIYLARIIEQNILPRFKGRSIRNACINGKPIERAINSKHDIDSFVKNIHPSLYMIVDNFNHLLTLANQPCVEKTDFAKICKENLTMIISLLEKEVPRQINKKEIT